MRWVWLSMTAGRARDAPLGGKIGGERAAMLDHARGRARDDRRRAPRVRRGRAAAARRGGTRRRSTAERAADAAAVRARAPPPSERMRASMSELMHGEAVDPIDALVTSLSEQDLQLGCYATHFEEGLPGRAALRAIEAHGGSSEKGALEDVWRKQWRDMPIRDRKRHARQLRVKGHVPKPPPRPAPALAGRAAASAPELDADAALAAASRDDRPPPRSTRPRATTARPTASMPAATAASAGRHTSAASPRPRTRRRPTRRPPAPRPPPAPTEAIRPSPERSKQGPARVIEVRRVGKLSKTLLEEFQN